MKKICIAAFAALGMLFSINANAQLSFGGGFASMSFSGADAGTSTIGAKYADEASLPGFYIGVAYDYAFSSLDGLTVEPGVYFEHFGKTFEGSVAGVTIAEQKAHANYLLIPINIKYSYEIAPDFKVGAYTGPRFNFGFGSAMKDVDKAADGGMGLKLFNAAWGIGASFTYANAVQLRMGYDWGFNKALKDPYNDSKVRRNEFHIGLAFLFDELF